MNNKLILIIACAVVSLAAGFAHATTGADPSLVGNTQLAPGALPTLNPVLLTADQGDKNEPKIDKNDRYAKCVDCIKAFLKAYNDEKEAEATAKAAKKKMDDAYFNTVNMKSTQAERDAAKPAYKLAKAEYDKAKEDWDRAKASKGKAYNALITCVWNKELEYKKQGLGIYDSMEDVKAKFTDAYIIQKYGPPPAAKDTPKK